MRFLLLLAALLPLTACAAMRPGGIVAQPSRDWRQVVTTDDRERLRGWRSAWTEALRQAQSRGYGPQLAAEGVLVQPDAALPGPAVPNGTYRCRVVKLGARSEGLLPFIAYPHFTCRLRAQADVQGLAKLGGSQRQVGLIFPHDQLRSVFLGTLVLGDEARAMQYGADRDRDLAGYVERIGPNRWRLVLPRPRFESLVDVVELVPA